MKLIIEDDEGRKTVVPLVGRGEITIGRQEGNTVRLTERNVSRKHALLVRNNGAVHIEDLNSFNGVRINGDRIQGRSKVNEGDLIQIGDYDLAIEQETNPEEPLGVDARLTEPAMEGVIAPGYQPPGSQKADQLPKAEPRPKAKAKTERPADPGNDDDGPGPSQSTAVIKSPYRRAGTEGPDTKDAKPLPADERPKLVCIGPVDKGRELVIEKTVVTIGRSDPATFEVDHRLISKLHARLWQDDSGWHVTDLESANGLKVNGEVYSDAPISGGDLIQLGHVQLKFLAPGEEYEVVDDQAKTQPTKAERGEVPKPAKAPKAKERPKEKDRERPHAEEVGEDDTVGGIPKRTLMFGGIGVAAVVIVGLAYMLMGGPKEKPEPEETVAVTPPPPAKTSPVAVAHEDPKPAPPAPVAVQPSPPAPSPPPPPIPAPVAPEPPTDAEQLSAVVAQTKALVRAKRWDKADEKLKEAESIDANDGQVQRLRREIDGAHGGKKHKPAPVAAAPDDSEAPPPPVKGEQRKKAQSLYDEAIASIGAGDYVGAVAKLERTIELDPGMADAHKGLGICYARLREPDKGAYEYEKYLKLKPNAKDAPDIRRLLQDYYKTRGDSDQ